MRCKNCGWENEPNVYRCIKCNAPLEGSMVDNGQSKHFSAEDKPLKKTLRESSADNMEYSENHFGSERNFIHDEKECVCERCGYPIAANVSECPMCHTPINRNSYNYHGDRHEPGNGNRSYARGGTENPWANPSKDSFCTLKRLSWQSEQIQYSPVSYSGRTIVLNRRNTDANNNSITSREQAVLTHENGEWFIENRSEQKTTLIRVDRKTKLNDGDIIVLGNRMFEFKKG